MLLLTLVTFLDLFVTVFNVLIIVRLVFSFFAKPENQFYMVIINLTEPLLIPVRKLLPKSISIDFSPTITIILLYIIDVLVGNLLPQAK